MKPFDDINNFQRNGFLRSLYYITRISQPFIPVNSCVNNTLSEKHEYFKEIVTQPQPNKSISHKE